MNYSINVSKNGKFVCEIPRITPNIEIDKQKLREFVTQLNKSFPPEQGYKLDVSEVRKFSKGVNIFTDE